MKIFFYINILSGGGAERVIANLSTQFACAGHEVGLITTCRTPNEYAVDEKVTRFVLEETAPSHNAWKRNFDRIRRLRAVIRAHRPDVVVSFMAEPNIRTMIATALTNTKTILSVRNDPSREYPSVPLRLLAKWLFRGADGMVFQTADARDWFPQAVQKHSAIIPNQVNPRFYQKELCTERHHIVTAGRLTPQKNQTGLIRAFSRIKDRVGDDLIIFGEGELRRELQATARDLGVDARVHLPGNVTDMEERLREAKLFVLPSDFEGMPNALMEAMALGLPCISTDCPCGGSRMLIENGVDGILVPVGDEAALAQAMEGLLTDEARAKAMGDAARKRAEDFRPERIYAQWENYVTDVVRS